MFTEALKPLLKGEVARSAGGVRGEAEFAAV